MSEIRTSIAPRRPSIFAANALYLAAAAGLVLMPMAIDPLAALLRFLFPALKTEELLLASTLVYYLPLLVAPCLIYAGRRQLWDGLRLTEPLSPAAAIYSALAAIASVPMGASVALLWMRLLACVGLEAGGAAVYVPHTVSGLILAVFYMGAFPALAEELAFRGLVLRAWERRGRLRALAVSSLLFASLHGSVAGFPAQLLLGFVLGALAQGSGSLWAGIIFHTVYNSLILISEYTVENLLPAAEAAAVAEPAVIQTALDALLFGAVVLFFVRRVWRVGKRSGAAAKAAREPGGLRAGETLLLVSGVVTALYLYGVDVLEMLGVLK